MKVAARAAAVLVALAVRVVLAAVPVAAQAARMLMAVPVETVALVAAVAEMPAAETTVEAILPRLPHPRQQLHGYGPFTDVQLQFAPEVDRTETQVL